jgi:hypothetical protein
MSSIVVSGDTSGTITLQAPAVSGTTTLTLPATSGTVITTTGGVTPSTAGNVLTSDGTNWTSAALNASSITTLASNVSVGTGTSFTISGLNLTSYKLLLLSLSGVTNSGSGAYTAVGTTPTASACIATGNISARYSMVFLDLAGQTQGPGASGSGQTFTAATGVTTASTSITVNCTLAFTGGTYYLYGMK